MFERLQKPFLTVETGEAYQPIRLSYAIADKERLLQKLEGLGCLEKSVGDTWNWFWRAEVEETHFESIDSFARNPNTPVRLGSLTVRDGQLYLNLASFKRACLAVPFFHGQLTDMATVAYADFLNKVYGLDERLPHGFTELFKEEELKSLLCQRVDEYQKVQEQCEHAGSFEEALSVLTDYTDKETHKKLPFVERYEFELKPGEDPDLIFLGFYIFLRGRELVAIRRWFGQTSYSLADAVEEAVEEVFGDVGIDIIE